MVCQFVLFWAQEARDFCQCQDEFTFISFDVKRPEIKNLGGLFRTGLGNALLDENFEGALIERLINESQDIQFARTQNRVAIGVMIDHIKHTRYMLMDESGIWNFSAIVKQLNRTPLLTQKFSFAIEELGRVLGVNIDPKLNFEPNFSIS